MEKGNNRCQAVSRAGRVGNDVMARDRNFRHLPHHKSRVHSLAGRREDHFAGACIDVFLASVAVGKSSTASRTMSTLKSCHGDCADRSPQTLVDLAVHTDLVIRRRHFMGQTP